MTFSPLTTRTITTRNQGPRNAGSRIDSIILHHAASANLEAILNMIATASRVVSYNYLIGNAGQIVGIVPEQNRSWSVANAAWDSRAITICHINERTGEPWPVSSAAHEASARLVADIHRRRGVPLNRTRIVGDRQIRATRCPGGLHMDDIVRRAQQIISAPTAPPPPPPRRRRTMSTLYINRDQNPARVILAGDSPGTTANWIETTNPSLVTGWTRFHGEPVGISQATFENFRRFYLQPLNTAGARAAVAVADDEPAEPVDDSQTDESGDTDG